MEEKVPLITKINFYLWFITLVFFGPAGLKTMKKLLVLLTKINFYLGSIALILISLSGIHTLIEGKASKFWSLYIQNKELVTILSDKIVFLIIICITAGFLFAVVYYSYTTLKKISPKMFNNEV